jgi:hypothetical protein
VEGKDTLRRMESLELISRRTFLSWLHFAVVLGGLAVGLLNFGDKVSCLTRVDVSQKLILRSERSLRQCTPSSVRLPISLSCSIQQGQS